MKTQNGFTLIELLVVIAVLGVLAAGVFTAINPLERMAQARDAQRKSNVGQLVQAATVYFTSKQGVYPIKDPTWIQSLVDSGDLKTIPPAPSNPACDADNTSGSLLKQNNYCLDYGSGEIIIFVALEATAEKNKCLTLGQNPYWLWNSANNKVCTICSDGKYVWGDSGTACL